jgi:glycolate oxidase FAD binding subunit
VTQIAPASVAEVSALLAQANRERQRVSIRGAGTKQGWGESVPPPTADIVLSTAKLNAVVAHRHGDLTATVEAGATLADVNRTLARYGQWIPVDPPWADLCTIGGLVATNDSGPRRHRYGAPRDLIIGIDIVRADGIVAKAGGIVVKNVAGYDVSRLMTGSFGSLAVIVSATFKLYPLPPASRTVVVELPSEWSATALRLARPEPVEGRARSGQAFAHRLGELTSRVASSQLTPTVIELQVPASRLLIRFETTERSAEQQADAVVSMAQESGATAAVVHGDDETALWADHYQRPWNGEGAVVKITHVPSAVAATLGWLADAMPDADYDVIGRAGVGVLLARIGGDAERQARIVNGLRERLAPPAGSVVVVRASDDLKSRVDVWGPLGDGLGVMRAIKRQFDPNGILNPGRGPGGL